MACAAWGGASAVSRSEGSAGQPACAVPRRQIAITAHVHRLLAARAHNGAASHGAFATWMWPPSQRTPVGTPDFSDYGAAP